MPSSRAVWSGYIRFSMVSMPVKAYSAAASGGGGAPALNQLHKDCNSRINYKKVCPIHGELSADQIVSGYQFAKDQYVVIDTDEIDKLRPKSEKDIAIAAFIKPDAIDPSQFTGKSYYLLPDGQVAAKPYALLVRAMVDQKRFAFAQVVFSGREQIVLMRPVGKVLMMSMLSYASDMKSRSEFEGDVPDVDLPAPELKLAKTLTDALSEEKFDLTEYKDSYADRLTKLVEAKVAGKEIVAPPDEPAPRAINLMEALQQSLDAAKNKKKPSKVVMPSKAAAKAGARKRKSS
ncbi:MAG: Ku protein [Anaerolineae bacterium]|nr:Ku protein [Phycisphaerae bacterium]